jgi:Tfp pilus assembly protein PilN
MIKINLIEKKKTFTAPVVLGVDFSNLPVKLIILAILGTQIPLSIFEGYLEGVSSEAVVTTTNLRKKQKALKREIKKNKKISEKLNGFNEKIVALKKRGEQVDLIIKTRTNPRHLLEKIARLTPEKLWLNKLTISETKTIQIEGGADTYRSIGTLIKGLNETAFFNKGLQLKDSKTVSEDVGRYKYRTESFVIEGKINAFNPFIEEEG